MRSLTIVYAESEALAHYVGVKVLGLSGGFLSIGANSMKQGRGYVADCGRIFLYGDVEMTMEHKAALLPIFVGGTSPIIYRLTLEPNGGISE